MQVVHTNTVLQTLSTAYIGDADLKIRGADLITDEGFAARRENYLLQAADARINNYSALYLTGLQKNNDIFELSKITHLQSLIFASYLKFGNVYLQINDDFITHSFVDESSRKCMFEIEVSIDRVNCQIAHQHGFTRYYLHYNGEFYFSSTLNTTFAQFKYIRDNNTLYLFARRTVNLYSITANTSNTSLIAVSPNDWKNYGIAADFYIQEVSDDLDNTWISYNTTDKNKLHVDPLRSAANLSGNTLFYNNYTYITGGTIKTNFLTLKNSHTHKNRSYRADNLMSTDPNVPNVNLREYTKLCTGVWQEGGADEISIPYEFYNADYKFKADEHTLFIMPEDMYPYTQLNINDSLLSKNGAIAGDTPYTADKIFFRDTRPDKSDGQYLCTWLSGGDPAGDSVWVDRYYLPERTSFSAALTSKSYFTYKSPVGAYISASLPPSAYYDAPYVWGDIDDEAAHTPQDIQDVIYGEYFFDKRSDMVLLPGQEYIYQRIGNQYVQSIVDSLSSSLIQQGAQFKTSKGVDIIYDAATGDVEYVLDNNSYAMVEAFRNVNDTSQMTVSFWLEADDWRQSLGHEILGNYNDRGFGVFSDQLITPIIMVQDGRSIGYYNTDFASIDTIYLSQSDLNTQIVETAATNKGAVTTTTNTIGYVVKDIHRTEHLDFCSPIIARYSSVDTSVHIDPFYAGDISLCGLLETEDGVPLNPDNLISTTGVSITGIQLEPCKYNTGLTPTTQV